MGVNGSASVSALSHYVKIIENKFFYIKFNSYLHTVQQSKPIYT